MDPLRIIAVLLACLSLVYGYGSITFNRQRWGALGGLAGMLLLAWLAVSPVTVEHRTPNIEVRTSNVEHRGIFVASTIQKDGKKAYHVPACYYAKRIVHPVEFGFESDAQAAGYRPCSECITPRLAGLK